MGYGSATAVTIFPGYDEVQCLLGSVWPGKALLFVYAEGGRAASSLAWHIMGYQPKGGVL